MKKLIINLILLSAVLLIAFSCSDSGSSNDETYYNGQGWKYFAAGNYEDALDAFDSALDLDFNNIEANVGKGWTLIMLDNSAVLSANSYLSKGVDDPTWALPARAGLAFIAYLQKEYSNCVAYINYVLEQDATFEFLKDNSIDYRDLLLLKAKVQYLSKDYEGCWTTIAGISSDYNGNSGDKATWVILGESFPTWQAYIAEVLYLLSEEMGNVG